MNTNNSKMSLVDFQNLFTQAVKPLSFVRISKHNQKMGTPTKNPGNNLFGGKMSIKPNMMNRNHKKEN